MKILITNYSKHLSVPNDSYSILSRNFYYVVATALSNFFGVHFLGNCRNLPTDSKIKAVATINYDYDVFLYMLPPYGHVDKIMLFPPRNLLKIVYPLEAPHLFLYTDYLTIKGKRDSLNTRISFGILTILRRLMGRLRDKIYQKELENFDVLICVNKKTKKFYSELVHETELDVLPRGIFPDEFPYCPIVEKRSKIIFTTGNHIQRKGFQYLIQAMPSIIKEADVKLYIAGKGPYTEILKKLVEKLNLNKKVVFTGFVSKKKLVNLYRMCDVFVHPSLSEGYCHTILEAMSVGRPVVCTDNFGSEMVKEGYNGYVVSQPEPDLLAEKILDLIFDDNKRCLFGKRSRKIVERDYDWNKIINKLIKIFKNL